MRKTCTFTWEVETVYQYATGSGVTQYADTEYELSNQLLKGVSADPVTSY